MYAACKPDVQTCVFATCAAFKQCKLQQHVKHAHLFQTAPQAWEWTSEQVLLKIQLQQAQPSQWGSVQNDSTFVQHQHLVQVHQCVYARCQIQPLTRFCIMIIHIPSMRFSKTILWQSHCETSNGCNHKQVAACTEAQACSSCIFCNDSKPGPGSTDEKSWSLVVKKATT